MSIRMRAEAEPESTPTIASGYVTDGERLLFVERVTHGTAGEPVVVAEDCRTLDILLFAASDFRRLRFRPVTATPAG